MNRPNNRIPKLSQSQRTSIERTGGSLLDLRKAKTGEGN